jgi:ABC-type dipeptide/oligopeptide/nickel transport system permease subunit
MRTARWIAVTVLSIVFAAAALADWVAPAPYARQFQDAPNARPSRQFPLGTDELGRDRLSRLLVGSRISLLLAPAAALLSTFLAALIGGGAGYLGGRWDRFVTRSIDLFLSLPWLFVLLTVRATLPLNVSPAASIAITIALLGLVGWAGPARVIRAGAQSLRQAEFILQARASGCFGPRLLFVHVLPNLRPVLLAQFWISVPVFILAESTLGLLGLGVTEPLPSWGNLLRGLESYSTAVSGPWALSPILLLFVVMSCLHLIFPGRDIST